MNTRQHSVFARQFLAVTLVSFCIALGAHAKTIALWPLGWDAANQRRDGHCEVDSANDLSFDSTLDCFYMTGGWGWTLPPNPDPDYPVANLSALGSTGTATAKCYAYSTTVGKYLTADKDFTLEGWFRFPVLPETGKTFFVADCGGSVAGDYRWFLTFRPKGDEYSKDACSWQIYFQALNTGNAVLYKLTDVDVEDITKGWHHWALVFNHRDAEGNAEIFFYQDGRLLGSVTKPAYAGRLPDDAFFGLGCRNVAGNVFTGSIDYCRLSDCILQPSQFLCGGSGKLPTKTLALWKLDKTADGGVNGAPSVGDARLYGGYFTCPSGEYNYSAVRPDVDCAFVSNPPNPTVKLPNGNFGSMFACSAGTDSQMCVSGVGRDLSFVNDFTVEGWIKICRQTTEDSNQLAPPSQQHHHICGTRYPSPPKTKGWCFQYNGLRGNSSLNLYANDGGILVNADVGNLAECEDRWIHLALAYDHADGEGKGVWRTYIDGLLTSCITNNAVPCDVASDSPNFNFGNMHAQEPYGMVGKLDCWRVAKAALRPTQLMCAREGAEEATDVVALWPLNVQNGAWLDGTDVVGAYTFEQRRAADCLATGLADAPNVPGVTMPANGSALFDSGTAGSRSTLFCLSDAINGLYGVDNRRGWTMEWMVKRTSEVAGDEVLFATTTPSRGLDIAPTAHMCLRYRPTGFWFWAAGVVDEETQFLDAQSVPVTLPVGVWKHVALVRRGAKPNYVYELFVDGVGRGSIAGTVETPPAPKAVQFGGLNGSESSWRGAISSIRITQGEMTSLEFLCSNTVVRKSTLWPLDSKNGAVDLSFPMSDLMGALKDVNGTITGSDDRARKSVPNVKTVIQNKGSVILAASSRAEAVDVDGAVDVTVPFTVEGWLRLPQTLSGRTTIVGTFTGTGGWKLVLDATGDSPAFRIYAKGNGERAVIVDDVLLDDVSEFQQAWHHLALLYDPAIGNGQWSLLVDRCPVGTPVLNVERPVTDFARQSIFRIGADDGVNTCAGQYDMWRVTSCPLKRSELLFPQPGLMFSIR